MSTTIDVAEMTVVHELKMSTPDMDWIARGLLAAAAKDEAFGVKYHAHIVADELSAIASSTDGFRVHQMHIPLRAPVGHVDAVVPRDALVWASKNARTFKPKKDAILDPIALLVFVVPAFPGETTHPGWVSVIYREWDDESAPSARFDSPLIREVFPPLDRIIDGTRTSRSGEPSPVSLSMLADAVTLQTAQTTTPTIQYTTGDNGRPGPVLLDFWENSVLRATALIQPTRSEVDE